MRADDEDCRRHYGVTADESDLVVGRAYRVVLACGVNVAVLTDIVRRDDGELVYLFRVSGYAGRWGVTADSVVGPPSGRLDPRKGLTRMDLRSFPDGLTRSTCPGVVWDSITPPNGDEDQRTFYARFAR